MAYDTFKLIFFSLDAGLQGLIANFGSTICELEINAIKACANSLKTLSLLSVMASSITILEYG